MNDNYSTFMLSPKQIYIFIFFTLRFSQGIDLTHTRYLSFLRYSVVCSQSCIEEGLASPGLPIFCGFAGCSSWRYKFTKCELPGNIYIKHATVFQHHSKSSCVFLDGNPEDKNGTDGVYGHNGNVLWTDNGCRASFKICYTVSSPFPTVRPITDLTSQPTISNSPSKVSTALNNTSSITHSMTSQSYSMTSQPHSVTASLTSQTHTVVPHNFSSTPPSSSQRNNLTTSITPKTQSQTSFPSIKNSTSPVIHTSSKVSVTDAISSKTTTCVQCSPASTADKSTSNDQSAKISSSRTTTSTSHGSAPTSTTADPNNSSQAGEEDNNGVNGFPVTGLVIVVIVAIIGFIVIGVVVWRKRRNSRQGKESDDESI